MLEEKYLLLPSESSNTNWHFFCGVAVKRKIWETFFTFWGKIIKTEEFCLLHSAIFCCQLTLITKLESVQTFVLILTLFVFSYLTNFLLPLTEFLKWIFPISNSFASSQKKETWKASGVCWTSTERTLMRVRSRKQW